MHLPNRQYYCPSKRHRFQFYETIGCYGCSRFSFCLKDKVKQTKESTLQPIVKQFSQRS